MELGVRNMYGRYKALSVVYPKMTHFTCVAYAFHRVAEVVRGQLP